MPRHQTRTKRAHPVGQSAFRKMCTFYSFHRICDDKNCRRARECRGDSRACFRRWWPYFPEEDKIAFRVSVRESFNGASPREVSAKVKAAVADYLETVRAEAERDARPAPSPRREAPQPRVRIG